jgi:serine protease Do
MSDHHLRPGLALAGCLTASFLVVGCSTAGAPSAGDRPSTSAASTGSGALVTDALPKDPSVCHGASVPDVVRKAEPSVVTVRTQQGLGSGIVYRKDIVLTDQHVVAVQEGQPQVVDQVRIALADGSTTTGKVIGSDLLTDLAVIRVGRDDLPPLTFRSSLPRQGETVLALGSPLGFSSSVTQGIVSAVGRNLPSSSSSPPLVDLIQTDAPISPGNSGGALLDTCGHVVGVNEAYIPPSSGAVSLGFATPSVVATGIADQLIAHGSAKHPYLGVRVTDLTSSIAQALGTKASAGVVVVGVVAGGPADTAGIRRGDVITAIGGHQVVSYTELLGALRTTEPGDTLNVTLDRQGRQVTVQVTVGSRK